MENNQSFKLIDGKYTPAEAKEVLLALISHKINFNQMAAFSVAERFNSNVDHYRRRVAELKEVKTSVLELIEQAGAEGLDIKVAGSFEITFVPKANPEVLEAPATGKQTGKSAEIEYYLA